MSGPAARVRVPVPADERLPQTAALLDVDAMGAALARSLGRHAPVSPVVRYLRYRPGKNLCVHYAVPLDGREQDAVAIATSKHDLSGEPANPAYAERLALVAGRAPAPQPLTWDPALGALVQWLPFDIDMPALAEPAAGLCARLRAAGVDAGADDRLELLQYRPTSPCRAAPR